jgi:hypothetical protein
MSININHHEKSIFNNAICIFIAIIYLFDQKINFIFNINGIGFLILLFTYIISYKFNTNRNDIFFIALVLIYIILSFVFSPCELTYKFIFSIILLPFLIIVINSGYLTVLVINNHISNFVLISVSISLIISANLDKIIFLDRYFRFYYEYSHVALYISPIIIYRLFYNYRDSLAWISVVTISVYSFSLTFFISLLVSLFIIARINNFKNFFIILLFPLILFSFLYSDHIITRFVGLFHSIDSIDSNISSLVWLNGFSMAYEYLKLTNGMGIGFNQMGCNNFGDIGGYSYLISQVNSGILLNFEDGSFAASKIISELGFLGLLIVGLLTFYSFNNLLWALNSKNFQNVNLLILSGSISTLICLYVRSAGYYQLHFILALSLLLSQIKNFNFSRN